MDQTRPQNNAPHGRVILLAPGPAPLARAVTPLARALARRGHTLALGIAALAGEPPALDAPLDLQLAIERAGGISLALSDSADPASLIAAVVDAFGRLDVAIAWDAPQAVRLAEAIARLPRRRDRSAVRAAPPTVFLIRATGATESGKESDFLPASATGLSKFKIVPVEWTWDDVAELAPPVALIDLLETPQPAPDPHQPFGFN